MGTSGREYSVATRVLEFREVVDFVVARIGDAANVYVAAESHSSLGLCDVFRGSYFAFRHPFNVCGRGWKLVFCIL